MQQSTGNSQPVGKQARSSLTEMAKELLVGFCVGVANIIPGVSGGTFLLIFGIYERVIGIVNRLSPRVITDGLKKLFSVVKNAGGGKSLERLTAFLRTYDVMFLSRLLAGAAAGIVVLSGIMKILLTRHFSVTYAFFFGLIVVSMIIPVRLMKTKRAVHLLFFLLGAALTMYTTIAVNPYDKVVGKSAEYHNRLVPQQEKEAGRDGRISGKILAYTGRYSAGEYLYVAFCGSVAISAMVLPGISGSFVLILMGQYFEVISAITDLKTLALDYILYLASFGAGLLIGIYFFAKLVDYVFTRYYDATMAFLVGLMAGSLYTLWPFKHYVIMDLYVKSGNAVELVKGAIVYTNKNILPENPVQVVAALIATAAGGAIMLFFARKEAV